MFMLMFMFGKGRLRTERLSSVNACDDNREGMLTLMLMFMFGKGRLNVSDETTKRVTKKQHRLVVDVPLSMLRRFSALRTRLSEAFNYTCTYTTFTFDACWGTPST